MIKKPIRYRFAGGFVSPTPLWKHQATGVAKLESRTAFGLLDECGLGKTVTALYTIADLIQGGHIDCGIVVCWRRHVDPWIEMTQEHWPDATVEVIAGKPKKLRVWNGGSTLYIVNYELLSQRGRARGLSDDENRMAEFMRTHRCAMVCDESHALKNKDAKVTKAVWRLGRAAHRRYMLTGTPVADKPLDLWAQLYYLDFGETLGDNYYKFANRYAVFHEWKGRRWPVKFKNLNELQERLSSITIRRLKSDCLDLPPKVFKHQVVTPDKSVKAILKPMCQSLIGEVSADESDIARMFFSQSRGRGSMAKLLQDMQRAAVIPRLYDNTASPGPKLEALIDTLENEVDGPAVVWCVHRDVTMHTVSWLRRNGVKAQFVHGGIPLNERNRMLKQFKDGEFRVLVPTVACLREAVTLTNARHAIYLQLGFERVNWVQSMDRCLAAGSLVFCHESVYNGHMSLVPIERIVAGDSVLTHTGRFRKVLSVKRRTFVGGPITYVEYMGWYEPLICTHDHKILVKRDGKLLWIEAHKLLPSDSMAFPKQRETTPLKRVRVLDEWRVHVVEPKKPTCCIAKECVNTKIVARGLCTKHYRRLLKKTNRPPKPRQYGRYTRIPDTIEINNDWLFLFGFYVAEGFAAMRGEIGRFISFSAHRKEIPRLARITRTLGTIGVKTGIYRRKGSKGVEMRAYNQELAAWFRAWFGHRAANKSLPKEILALPPSQASVFLDGYVAGDGYKRAAQTEWCTASKTLCYQMCQLAIRAGYIPTMRRVPPKPERNQKEHWVGGYTLPGAKGRCADQDHRYVYRPIRNVFTKYERRMHVYDIEVEDDHSFTCGFSSVHNCHRIGQTGTVVIETLECRLSLDGYIRKTILVKDTNADAVVDGRVAKKRINKESLTAYLRRELAEAG